MEDQKENNSGFWLGLIIGAVATGLIVYLLDKEDKDNLVKNLKKDWDVVSRKIKEVVGENVGKDEENSDPNVQPLTEETQAVKRNILTKRSPPKFFKKNGKKVRPAFLHK